MNTQKLYSLLALSDQTKKMLILFAVVLAVILIMSGTVQAGGGGGEFDEVWDTLEDWTKGTLGKIIAGAMILVGIVGGVVRQSLMAFAVGIAGGMGLNYTPEIISAIMTATLEHAQTASEATIVISNGLF